MNLRSHASASRSTITWLSLTLLSVASAACSGGNGSDAGSDAAVDAAPVCMIPRAEEPRADRLVITCAGPVGDESAAACNQRLAMDEPGARFFIGSNADCFPDPNSCACSALCSDPALGDGRQCGFSETATGCSFNAAGGFGIIVEVAGRRARAGLGGAYEMCEGDATRRWARLNYDDLRTAAQCARATPAGGFGTPEFGACETPDAPCEGGTGANTCTTFTLMTGSGPAMINECTRECMANEDCGPRGVCNRGSCFDACGGPCALPCQDGFTCAPAETGLGSCLRNPA